MERNPGHPFRPLLPALLLFAQIAVTPDASCAQVTRASVVNEAGPAKIGAASVKQLEPTGVPATDEGAIYLIDLNRCEPAIGLRPRFHQGAWKVINYEAETFKGSMLYSIAGLNSPAVTYRLKLQGWYAIYLGFHDSNQRSRPSGRSTPLLMVKLSDDEVFSYVEPEQSKPSLGAAIDGSQQSPVLELEKKFLERYNSGAKSFYLSEVFWKSADLSGQDLIFRATNIADANISFVKLVPLGAAAVARLKADANRGDTKRLIGVFDASSMTYQAAGFMGPDWIRSQIEAYRASDFGIVLWGTNCGLQSYYPTKVGEPPKRLAVPPDSYGHSSIYPLNEFLLDVRIQGEAMDPLKEAIAHAHKLGLKLYASVRPEGPLDPPNDESAGEFYDRHPEYLCRSREGYPLAHLSLAYPEVRLKWIELLREQVRYGADGINFVFVRGYPFVGYDPPIVTAFQQQYGLDPTKVKESDERWLKLGASFVTQFLREIRKMLDEEARRQGRSRLGTAYHTFGSPTESLQHHLDVRTWIADDLVDQLLVYPYATKGDASDRPDPVKVAGAYVPIIRGSRTQLYVHAWPRVATADAWLKKAIDLYAAGADGIALWDVDSQLSRPGEWAMVRKLGHRDELNTWKGEARRYLRLIPLKSLGGRVMDKYYQTGG